MNNFQEFHFSLPTFSWQFLTFFPLCFHVLLLDLLGVKVAQVLCRARHWGNIANTAGFSSKIYVASSMVPGDLANSSPEKPAGIFIGKFTRDHSLLTMGWV